MLSLEVLIYEYFRIYNDQGAVITLSIAQLGLLLLLSFVWRPKLSEPIAENLSVKPFDKPYLALISIAPLLAIILGIGKVVPRGYEHLLKHPELLTDLSDMLVNSLLFSVGSGIFILILFLGFSSILLTLKQHQLMSGFLSASFVASALWMRTLFPGSGFYTEAMQFIVGFGFLYFPFLYRLSWGERMQELRGQIEIARTLGADSVQILLRIVWPQIIGISLKLSGLCAVWTAGDFAYSQIVLSNRYTFSQYLNGLMSSYRLEAATSLTVLLVGLCMVVYLLFWGIGYVLDQKA